MHDFYTENFFYSTFNIFYPGVTKFQYFACIGHDYVIVLFIFMGFFKLCKVLPKLMFSHKITSQEKVNCIIQSGSAYPVIFVLHFYVERLYIKMPFVLVYFIEYSESLRRLSMAVLF